MQIRHLRQIEGTLDSWFHDLKISLKLEVWEHQEDGAREAAIL